ncbi:MAG TPA: sugar kinase [Sphingomonas sp.]
MSRPIAAKVVCFGELLLRLSAPNHELLFQTDGLKAHFGGAEANVAVGLASLGHDTAMVSRVPDHRLGDAAIENLRRHGVNVRGVARGGDRLGLYFLTPGASLRASEIVYDRAGSSLATAAPGFFDWPALLQGADRLHLSGITPALGPGPAALAVEAAEAARAAGVPVSFDGNYRARLWEAWDSRPREILGELVGHADILFGNHRDIALLLDRPFSGDGEERRREAAEAALAAFPKLRWIASTARHADAADVNRLAARIDSRARGFQTEDVTLSGIVDRIGAGDAFAVGVLHALHSGGDEAEAARTGLALAALKHSLPGDASLFNQRDIDAFHAEGLDVRR